MDWKIILAIAGGALLVLIILTAVFVKVFNDKKGKKLNQVLEEYKKQAKEELDPNITISGEQDKIKSVEEDVKVEDYQPTIEDYSDQDILNVGDDVFPTEKESKEEEDWATFVEKQRAKQLGNNDDIKFVEKRSKSRRNEEDDFEEFLDKYSYTRKIIDKDLLKKLNSLPPEVKEMILGNVFNKYD